MRLAFWHKQEEQQEDTAEEPQEPKADVSQGGVSAELNRIQVKLESFDEIRKANAERFSRISEQIGELRGMILDTNRSASSMEVKITKTNDLVETVQPDKLMIEVRKTDGKIEAVRANIESNEAMIKTVVSELKDLRNKIAFFRGIDQVMKLNEDIKKELTGIQKVKATVERHADKAETIFSELQSRFQEVDKFAGQLKELNETTKQLNDAADTLKVQMAKKSDRQEVEKLMKKFNEFEVHVGNVIDLMSRKAKDLNDAFGSDVKRFHEMFDLELKKSKKVLDLIEELSKETPNLDKNLRSIKDIEALEKKQEDVSKADVAAPKGLTKPYFAWLGKKPAKKPEAKK